MKTFMESENLQELVKNSTTLREVILKSGRSDTSTSYKSFKKLIEFYKIDTSHFLSKRELIKKNYIGNKLPTYSNEKIFAKNNNISRTTVKNRIIRDKIIDYECVFCGNEGEWMGKKMTLILDP